ncbi:MAG: magnesium transporter [Chlamydiales bacterium]|nr:magnesium transporter [Chlamydiia bacterium]MCP5507661.1 magnesium transporter [Chlamydiales bacterium]
METENREEAQFDELTPIYGVLSDFKSSQLDDALEEQIEDALLRDTQEVAIHDVAKISSSYDPVDLAHAASRLPPNARIIVYDNLPDIDSKVIFIINTGNNTRSVIFRQLDDQEIKSLFERIPADEAVWLLDDMSDRRMKRILDGLEPQKALRIRELQRHDRHSAGRLMTDEFFAFSLDTTIGDVAKKIRENPGIDLTRRIFVVDNEDRLIGFVPGRNLIVNAPYVPIRQVMRPINQKVSPETSRDEVVDIVERYKIPALPVVNTDDQMIGVITYEDVVEAMEDIADETIASIAGTGEIVGEHEPIFKRFLWRAPWLLVTICAGLVTFTAMSHFSSAAWFSIVPFFVPMITGISGNVGIQCSTVLVRGLSTGEISYGHRGDAIAKEIGIGMLIGTIFGIFSGAVVFLLNHFGIQNAHAFHGALAVTVSCGVFVACMTATFLGTFSPFFFARFNIDPAVSSGPIVTACNDVLSTLMFFLVVHSLYYVLFI